MLGDSNAVTSLPIDVVQPFNHVSCSGTSTANGCSVNILTAVSTSVNISIQFPDGQTISRRGVATPVRLSPPQPCEWLGLQSARLSIRNALSNMEVYCPMIVSKKTSPLTSSLTAAYRPQVIASIDGVYDLLPTPQY